MKCPKPRKRTDSETASAWDICFYASPDDCLLTLRGLKTLHVRMKMHFASALQVAQWLQNHPLVRDVLYPALPSHPVSIISGSAISAARQASLA
ncbi:MAG: PLP-dependent transferase [Desulfomicrobium sp.]|nr:PLP-dependent transferase [Desulfomicrobium sp.]